MLMPEPYISSCVSNCKVRRFSLGVHYSLLVFTQKNVFFVCTVNYVHLNIKTKYQIQNHETLHCTENVIYEKYMIHQQVLHLSKKTLFVGSIPAFAMVLIEK